MKHLVDCGPHTAPLSDAQQSEHKTVSGPGVTADRVKRGERVSMLTSRTKQPSRKKINNPTFSICRKEQRRLCQSAVSSMPVSCENYLTDPPSVQGKVGDVPWRGAGQRWRTHTHTPTPAPGVVWCGCGGEQSPWSWPHPCPARPLEPTSSGRARFQGERYQHMVILWPQHPDPNANPWAPTTVKQIVSKCWFDTFIEANIEWFSIILSVYVNRLMASSFP